MDRRPLVFASLLTALLLPMACSDAPTTPGFGPPRALAPSYAIDPKDTVRFMYEGRSLSLIANIHLDVSIEGTSGEFERYTQAITSGSVPKVCNTTLITLRAAPGGSSRPILSWETAGHPVQFDFIGSKAASGGKTDFAYRGTKCIQDGRNAKWVSRADTFPLAWSGDWAVLRVQVKTTGGVFRQDGSLLRQLSVSGWAVDSLDN